MKLHLGVIEFPYGQEDGEAKTTGDVAESLEARYAILQKFFDRYEKNIATLMESSVAGALENIMAGAPMPSDPFAEAMGEVHNLFVQFLEKEELNGEPGVPTRRAMLGISSRFKNKKGDPRASFVDTGLYEASMRAWVSEVMSGNN